MLTKDEKKILKEIENNLKKNRQSISELIGDLDVILIEFNDEQKVKLLKKSELFIDRRGTNIDIDLVEQLLKFEHLPNYFKKYLLEVKIINKLFAESYKLQKNINSISPRNRLYAILTTIQKRQKIARRRAVIYYDKAMELINNTLKSLVYDNQIFNGGKFLFKKCNYFSLFFNDEMKIAEQYIEDSFITCAFEEEYEEWKAGYRTFLMQGERIVSSISDDSLLFFYQTNLKEIIINYLYDFYYGMFQGIDVLRDLNSQKHLFDHSRFLLEKKYLCDIDSIKINSIPAIEWMKAYIALKLFVKDSKKKKIWIQNSAQWIAIMVKYGVEPIYAEKLFASLILDKKSVDLYDNPFIPCEAGYFIIPWMIKDMDVGKVLLSKFSNKRGIDFKGATFERHVLDVLKYFRLPAVKLHNKFNGEEFECDVAFLIDDTLCLCECKNRNINKSNEFFVNDMDDDIYQINRISTFYEAHPSFVQSAFKKAGYKNIKYKKIIKFVIYSQFIHEIIEKDSVILMDISKFFIPFGRDQMTEYLSEKFPKIKEFLSGSVTASKIIGYYRYPVHFFEYNNLIEIFKVPYKIGSCEIIDERIKINDWRGQIDNDFLFDYCLNRKLQIAHICELYEMGRISKDDVPPGIQGVW